MRPEVHAATGGAPDDGPCGVHGSPIPNAKTPIANLATLFCALTRDVRTLPSATEMRAQEGQPRRQGQAPEQDSGRRSSSGQELVLPARVRARHQKGAWKACSRSRTGSYSITATAPIRPWRWPRSKPRRKTNATRCQRPITSSLRFTSIGSATSTKGTARMKSKGIFSKHARMHTCLLSRGYKVLIDRQWNMRGMCACFRGQCLKSHAVRLCRGD